MKKLLIAASLLVASQAVNAQKLDGVNKFFLLNKYDEAKTEIDKVWADPKAEENPKALLLKTKVYAELYLDSAMKVKYPDAGKVAYETFVKYIAKDTALKELKEDNGMRAVSIIYSNNFNEGRKAFSDSKWNDALGHFTIAEEMGDLISKKNLGNNKQNIDTFTVVYAGYAAQNAKNTERALYYYKKFAAEKIGGKDFVEIYRFILNDALEHKKEEDFKKYLALAKELYPSEATLWSAYEMEYLTKNASVKEMLEKYKKEDAAGSLTGKQYASYGEMFANASKEEFDSTELFNVKSSASEAFAKAFKTEQNGVYAFNAGVILYQQFNLLEDKFYALRGADAGLKAKRDEVEKQEKALADSAIGHMEAAYTLLKAKTDRDKVETSCLSKSVDFLANLYQWKRDKARGKNVQDYDKFDAKFKQYDAEHGQYK
ncbi:hypothetical protein [Filimonas effusa]|uniref:Tetratricopeptide repeat protein n=1 Tax=Filimonas effusa TaxID=2508721 RepID=A0A4Q1D9S0_9BACT|nr:hypothetical protein [Filimonas effusa]RXK86124.1 hypothetical protein ESB13_04755 [Filimonas effusa]